MEYRIQGIWFPTNSRDPFQIGRRSHRVMQNRGGPCPLIGICNVLLLNNDICVNKNVKKIAFKVLTDCLTEHLQRLFQNEMNKNENMSEQEIANKIKNIEDCVKLFPRLEEGLDINIKFSGVADFEFTPQIAMFDNYSIRILHGWVVDPQNTRLYNLIGNKSYNEVVDFLADVEEDPSPPPPLSSSSVADPAKETESAHETEFVHVEKESNEQKTQTNSLEIPVEQPDSSSKIDSDSGTDMEIDTPTPRSGQAPPLNENPSPIETEKSTDKKKIDEEEKSPPKRVRIRDLPPDLLAQRESDKQLIREFLGETRQQLTAYGLTQMYSTVKEKQLCIFFHNNHFSCLIKWKGKLFTLVTDEGIIDADPRITWQTLTQLDGDEEFVSNKFLSLSAAKSQIYESRPMSQKGSPEKQKTGLAVVDLKDDSQKPGPESSSTSTSAAVLPPDPNPPAKSGTYISVPSAGQETQPPQSPVNPETWEVIDGSTEQQQQPQKSDDKTPVQHGVVGHPVASVADGSYGMNHESEKNPSPKEQSSDGTNTTTVAMDIDDSSAVSPRTQAVIKESQETESLMQGLKLSGNDDLAKMARQQKAAMDAIEARKAEKERQTKDLGFELDEETLREQQRAYRMAQGQSTQPLRAGGGIGTGTGRVGRGRGRDGHRYNPGRYNQTEQERMAEAYVRAHDRRRRRNRRGRRRIDDSDDSGSEEDGNGCSLM